MGFSMSSFSPHNQVEVHPSSRLYMFQGAFALRRHADKDHHIHGVAFVKSFILTRLQAVPFDNIFW